MSTGDNSVEETEWERARADVMEDKWALYENEYADILEEYGSRVDDMGTEGRRNFLEGTASSGASKSFGEASDALESNLGSAMNPNSGGFKAKTGSLRDAQGSSTAEAVTRADMESQDQHVMGLSNFSALGRGDSVKSQAGLSEVARLSADNALDDAISEFNSSATTSHNVGTGLGAAATYFANGKKTTNDPFNASASKDYSDSLAAGFDW